MGLTPRAAARGWDRARGQQVLQELQPVPDLPEPEDADAPRPSSPRYSRSVGGDGRRRRRRTEGVVHGPSSSPQVRPSVGNGRARGGVREPRDCGRQGTPVGFPQRGHPAPRGTWGRAHPCTLSLARTWPRGDAGQGNGIAGAVQAGVKGGERGQGLLTAQSSGRHSAELTSGGEPAAGAAAAQRYLRRIRGRRLLPPQGSASSLRAGRAGEDRALPPWCSEGQQPHPQAGGGHGGLHSCTEQEQLPSHLPAGVEGIHFRAARQCRCPKVPLPAAAPALGTPALTVGVGVGHLLVGHDTGRGVVHLEREGRGSAPECSVPACAPGPARRRSARVAAALDALERRMHQRHERSLCLQDPPCPALPVAPASPAL